jgi:hypothetical protein
MGADAASAAQTVMSLTATLALLAAAQFPALDGQFDVALGTLGLTRGTATFDPVTLPFYRQGEFETTLSKSLHADPWRTPYLLDMAEKRLEVSTGQPAGVIEVAGWLAGGGARRSLLGDPVAQAAQAASQPGALVAVLGRYKEAGLIKGSVPAPTGVPREVQTAAALVLQVALDTIGFRRAAFAGSDVASELRREQTVVEDEPAEAFSRRLRAYRSAEPEYLWAGAQDVGAAVAQAESLLRTVGESERYAFEVATEWGRVVLRGGASDSHDGAATLLLVDTSGDDTYLNQPATQSATNWLSVVIDTRGNDRYVSDPTLVDGRVADWPSRGRARGQAGPCSAFYGLAFLVDSAGDDVYRSHRSAFGSAVFGVAYLLDREGNDEYEAYADAQGFGKFGIGVLEDLAGNDRYTGFQQVQACGLTRGVGLLLDRAGDDRYVALDSVIDFPSPQSAEHNVSLAQGAGYGLRGDYLTGKSLAGGIGWLSDGGGDDQYSCGVFGQGTGYWQGVGVLRDKSGKDTYTGVWYVQGASAHFAVGVLMDGLGDDTYTATMNMAQGAGHDFGFGFLWDGDGRDKYTAPNLSLGAGNANGIGIFVEGAGDDTYASSGISLGQASEGQKGSMREECLTLGVFMDLGGQDTYPEAFAFARNGARQANWTDRRTDAARSQGGVFWDRN